LPSAQLPTPYTKPHPTAGNIQEKLVPPQEILARGQGNEMKREEQHTGQANKPAHVPQRAQALREMRTAQRKART